MKIFSLTLKNICGVEQGEILADGQNAVITGQNGTGKTTYANAYSLLMTGKFFDGTAGEVNKLGTDGNFIRDKKTHAVEVTFDNEQTFRREFLNQFDKSGNFKGTTQKFFVGGVPKKQKEFDAKIFELTQGMPINLFGFCKMNWKERRQILMAMIHVDNQEILKKFPELDLGKLDVQSFIDAKKTELKKLDGCLQSIPARIDELQKNLVEGDLAESEKKLFAKSEELKKLQNSHWQQNTDNSELRGLLERVSSLEFLIQKYTRLADAAKRDFALAKEKYFSVKNSVSGTCPTCGQKMPTNYFEKQKKVLLKNLMEDGKNILSDCKQAEEKVFRMTEELKKANELLHSLEVKKESEPNLSAQIAKIDQLTEECANLRLEIATLRESEKNRTRIEELKNLETEYNAEIAKHLKEINLAEKFRQEVIKSVEDAINSKFGIVKFRMFDTCINGTVKEICEPMMGGVTFDNLSRGEKFKVSLDILRTMQKFYGVELPVWIDDAESYTSNSFVELPNQIFLMKAVEGQTKLKIEVEKKTEVKAA